MSAVSAVSPTWLSGGSSSHASAPSPSPDLSSQASKPSAFHCADLLLRRQGNFEYAGDSPLSAGCAALIVSVDGPGGRASSEWKERGGGPAKTRPHFRSAITSVVRWLVVVREQRQLRLPAVSAKEAVRWGPRVVRLAGEVCSERRRLGAGSRVE